MKIIALPDLHGRTDRLALLAPMLRAVDLVLLPGDLSNGSIEEAARVVEAVRQFNEQILAIPGNMDTTEVVDYLAEQGLDLHRQHRVVDGISFLGVGGALPYVGDFVFSEAELRLFLEEAAAGLDPDLPQVLVCHQPPMRTAVDMTYGGQHVGSTTVRAFIEQRQPLLCFTGHIHEARSIDQIARSRIINPGPLWKGMYAYAEIERGRVETLELRKISTTGPLPSLP